MLPTTTNVTAKAGESTPGRRSSLRARVGVMLGVLAGDPFMLERWRWLRPRLRRGPCRTLDAGCGSGLFAMFAARHGNDVIGISFEEAPNVKGRRRAALLGLGDSVEFRTADLRRLGEIAPEIGTFDQVLCFETIEHIADDDKLVRDLASVLRPGGHLLLTTPSSDHRPFAGEDVSGEEDGAHVRFGYSHDDVRRLMTAAGLVVEEEGEIAGALSQWIWNLAGSLIFRFRIPARLVWLLTFPLRVVQLIDRPVTRVLRRPYVSVAVVARAP